MEPEDVVGREMNANQEDNGDAIDKERHEARPLRGSVLYLARDIVTNAYMFDELPLPLPGLPP
jgi:hypothetical protein